MKASSNAHLRRTLLCALVAGSIAAPFAAQTAYALPIEGANAATNADAASITTSGTVMDITGKTEHNILRWEDFSIEQNEKVRFDGGAQSKDYLNLVTGEGASNIYGTIEGGRNIYLVNPHGILFAEGSQVNTGALYLSTANPADIAAATNTFKTNGTSPLSATAQTGDVLNLGTVKASKLYIEGKNVKVLNTDDIQNTDGTALTGANVTIRSEKAPHIGYDVGNRATANFDESGGSVQHSFYDYANPNTAKSASGRGWEVMNLGGAAHTDYDYMRVHDIYDLQNINAKRDGRYILAGDIDATATQDWNSGEGFAPLGGGGNKFTGRLDGAGHTLRGLYINRRVDLKIGLFGSVKGATIENLSLRDGNVKGNYVVGGIVGVAESTVIRNVSYAGTVAGTGVVGGIVGSMLGGSIQNAWNAGTVRGSNTVGGIAGQVKEGSTFQNVCNTGAISGSVAQSGGIAGYIENSRLQNAWNTGEVRGDQQVGGIVGNANGGSIRHAISKSGSAGQAVGESKNGADVTTDVKVAPEADMKLAATYTSWKDERGNALVATEGGVGTPWRIYDGKTMPLLTGLMKGTKRLAKVYDGNVFATTDPHITLVHTGKDVGTYDAYSDQFGYDLIGGATITQRVLTMSGIAAQSKTYDGTTSADAAQFHATLNNVVAGEESLVTATATGAAYNSKDVASANKVNYALALSGTGAANYRIASTVQGAGNITAKQLNLALTGGARFDKTYDGNANVTQTLTKDGNYTLTNFVNGEGADIALAPVTGTYTDKNAGTGKTVTFGGLTLTGAGAGNYSLSATTLTATGDIAKKALTLEGTAGTQFTKTYDGNANVTQNLVRGTNYRLAGVAPGEGTDIVALNESAAQGAYATANAQAAGAQQNVTFTNLSLTGSGAGNYTLAARKTFENAGRITPKELTLALTSGTRFDKTYDGNANVAQTLAKGTNYSLTGFVTGEGTDIELSAVTGKYADKNAARDKAVTFGGLTLTGAGAGNYVLNSPTLTGTGTIARRALTLGAVAAQTKTYDGNTLADASKFGAALNNAVAGDSVTATATGAAYNDKNVTAANRIDYTGVALAGADAGNYTLAASAVQGTGTITRRMLTASAVGAQTKTYDGTTAADTSQFRATLNNVVAGEENLVAATATGAAYNDKNVAGANRIDYTGVALTGTGAGNYSLAATAEGAGKITPKELNLALTSGARFDKTYDGNNRVDQSLTKGTNYTLTGFVGTEGDHLALAAATGTYTAGKDAGTDKEVTFKNLTLAGTGAGNYTLDKTALTGIGTITRRALTLGSVAAQSKTYDGTTAADASQFRAALTNAIAGDSVAAAATGAAYNDKNVAAANRIDYTGVALAGADAGNYSLAATTVQGAGTITKRTLTASAVGAQTKTYDGSVSADAGKFSATLGNTIAGDSVTATAADAAYNSKDVAAANAVNYTGVALGGSDAGNYTLAATTAQGTGTITKRALTLGAVTAQSKTYDGTTAADAAQFHATLNNAVAGDSVTATAAGAAYNDKNVAAANAVNYTGLSLTGTSAANYSIVSTAQGAGSIAPRDLTLTADAKTATQGEPLPSFTGKAQGFTAGEDERVLDAGGLSFESSTTNTDTPGSYGVTGRIGSMSDGTLGNYRIRQAAGNATALTIHAAALPGGLLASLVQDAAPRFDMGFGQEVYVFGLPRPIPTATLGIYRFAPARDLLIEGLRLD